MSVTATDMSVTATYMSVIATDMDRQPHSITCCT